MCLFNGREKTIRVLSNTQKVRHANIQYWTYYIYIYMYVFRVSNLSSAQEGYSPIQHYSFHGLCKFNQQDTDSGVHNVITNG